MLLTETVIMKWHNLTKNWYESRGYIFTKMRYEFEVNVKDLTSGCHSLVDVKCDCEDCTTPILKPIPWDSYKRYVHKDGKYYCQKCANRLFANENARKTKLLNGKSFEKWCYDNLSKEESENVLSRWDYELNINKNGEKLIPSNVNFTSIGFDKKGYWFKCLEHPEHKSEQKHISSFANGRKGSMNCNQCKSIALNHPQFIKFFVHTEDSLKYSVSSDKKVLMKCPDCGFEKNMMIHTLSSQGFSCPKCGDGVSYPEKFMFSLLEQLKLDFKPQLNKANFDWCDKYKYDFYIPSLNIIIETHGLQHYEQTRRKGARTLKEEIENDRTKQELALTNGIKKENYIVIDCRKSELEFIKDNIITSRLSNIFDLSKIDWLKCHEYACSSRVKEVCDLWENGMNDTIKIADKLKIGKTTVNRYLNAGVNLGWCKYIKKYSMSPSNFN